MKLPVGRAEADHPSLRRLEISIVRTASVPRLLLALGLVGLTAAAPAPAGRPPRPVTSMAVGQPAYDEPASHVQELAPPKPSPRTIAAPARPARKAARPRISASKPVAVHPAAARHRSTTVSHASAPQTATKPVPRAKAKPKPPPPPQPPPSGGASSAYESRILALVNAQRGSSGLSALSYSSCADTYAERWSVHLAAIGALVHQSLGGLLGGCHSQFVGENIGFGGVSADTMVAMWMASPSHRANIMNSRFTHIGIGAVQTSSGVWYAVQDFLDL